MKQRVMSQFDTVDGLKLYEYLENRIEALQQRIVELEAENAALRFDGFINLNPPFVATA